MLWNIQGMESPLEQMFLRFMHLWQGPKDLPEYLTGGHAQDCRKNNVCVITQNHCQILRMHTLPERIEKTTSSFARESEASN